MASESDLLRIAKDRKTSPQTKVFRLGAPIHRCHAIVVISQKSGSSTIMMLAYLSRQFRVRALQVCCLMA